MTTGSCPPPDLNQALPASLAAARLHPNQCAVHWPITCPSSSSNVWVGQTSACQTICAHYRAISSGAEIEVAQDDATGARSWSTPCFQPGIESNMMVRQGNRMPRGAVKRCCEAQDPDQGWSGI